uniref:Uncharacterized protein n=1 Tax=Ixodes ricinus TaxID=34613 RepID=A0A147BKL8_IXORI
MRWHWSGGGDCGMVAGAVAAAAGSTAAPTRQLRAFRLDPVAGHTFCVKVCLRAKRPFSQPRVCSGRAVFRDRRPRSWRRLHLNCCVACSRSGHLNRCVACSRWVHLKSCVACCRSVKAVAPALTRRLLKRSLVIEAAHLVNRIIVQSSLAFGRWIFGWGKGRLPGERQTKRWNRLGLQTGILHGLPGIAKHTSYATVVPIAVEVIRTHAELDLSGVLPPDPPTPLSSAKFITR